MTPRPPNPSGLIYQVIRGERPCTDLFQLGVKIDVIDDKWQIESPPLESVRLHISDVAHGLFRYRASPIDAKKWARLVLCGPFIDLSECETQAGWEVLLNALWDAMGTGTFSNSALHLAEKLAK
jgi:hypothetical protein